jgi:hypothetical protein
MCAFTNPRRAPTLVNGRCEWHPQRKGLRQRFPSRSIATPMHDYIRRTPTMSAELNGAKLNEHVKNIQKLTRNHQKKPYSSVTVTIENLTSERYEEDDVGGIPDLVEVVGLQATGPTEAARAIRKKLKYGNVHRQIRALVLLDGLIQNGGARFQRTFADEMLLERLRVCGTSDLSDPLVKDKCKELFRSWAAEYKNTRGLEQIAGLYKVGINRIADSRL